MPQVGGRSLVYVDGAEALPRKNTTSRKDPGGSIRATPLSAAVTAKIPSGIRAASLGLSMVAAAAAAASAGASGVGTGWDMEDGEVGQERHGDIDEGTREIDALPGTASVAQEGRGDCIRLVGEIDLSKPGYLQVKCVLAVPCSGVGRG